jgi:catechol 2,3-dioxygenase-like lactoylglutathione lyase family enzyme
MSAEHRRELECVIPILRVEDLDVSLDYYIRALGFVKEWHAPGMASVGRDGFSIMLSEGDQGSPGTWVWIGVEDADRLYAEWTALGARIAEEPANYPWAYEFRVADPDGHILRIGSDPRPE